MEVNIHSFALTLSGFVPERFLHSNSPFWAIWLLFVVFFGVVLVVHVVCAMLAAVFRWRVRLLMKKVLVEDETS